MFTFKVHPNFNLDVNNWGEAPTLDILALLDNVISVFYEPFNHKLLPSSKSLVMWSENGPEIRFVEPVTTILLSAKDCYWSQFAYQFSHELCHYVVNKEFPSADDRFGWLEESLCELASLLTLSRMAQTWEAGSAPYPHWVAYSESITRYLNNILDRTESEEPSSFAQWLNENLQELEANRYLRDRNRVVAKHLYPHFENDPRLWVSLQYLNQVDVTRYPSLRLFLYGWAAILPQPLSVAFKIAFKDLL